VFEIVSIFTNNIAPVLIVAGIGFLAGRAFQIESRSLAKLIFNVFSPALVFYSLYTSEIDGHEFAMLILVVIAFQLLMAGLAYVVMRLQHANRLEQATVVLSAFCLNAGNFGLSVAAFAFGDAVLARAIAVWIGNTILNNTLGVFIASNGSQPVRKSLVNILRVPAFYATAAAFLLRGLNIELPPMLLRSAGLLKDASIPSMIILLGLQMSQSVSGSRRALVGSGVIIRLLAGPLIGLGLVLVLPLTDLGATAFLLQASMPTAVMTLILAKEYHLDETLMLNLIMVTTLVSPFTLSIIILLLKKAYFGG
jgi:predicted permease